MKELDTTLESIELWLQAAQPDKAEVVARTLVLQQPEFAIAHATLARVLLVKVGAAIAANLPERAEAISQEALEEFEEAIRLGDLTPEVIRGAGIAAEQAGRLEEAISWYESGAANDEATALYLALALLRAERVAEARAIIEPLRERRPTDPFLHATFAECLSAEGQNELAQEVILQAIQLAPDEPAFRIRRAAMLRREGKSLLAAETILALPEQFRTSLPATEELTAALLEGDRKDLAADAWAAYARAHPDSPSAIIRTVQAYIAAGNLPEARMWMDILLATAPNHPEAERLQAFISEGAAPRQEE
jgi:tetratricopeptide (TPR) repeat protein